MDNKPEFWDFYRAIRKSKKDDSYLEVRSKETGSVTVYYKTDSMQSAALRRISFLISVIIAAVIIVTSINDLWPSLQIDLNFINFGLGYLLSIYIYRRIYERVEFEEVPEEEWSDSEQVMTKPHRAGKLILRYISIAVILLFFLSSYSYTYFRYLFEDGTGKAYAEVSFHTSEKTEVVLDSSTPEGAVFEGRLSHDDVMIKVKLKKIPDNAALYVNGEEADMDSIRKEFHFFWEDEYFESSAYALIYLNRTGEVNTLEIKTNSFDKVWTFTLKGEKAAA